jgi:hypothetical protein
MEVSYDDGRRTGLEMQITSLKLDQMGARGNRESADRYSTLFTLFL